MMHKKKFEARYLQNHIFQLIEIVYLALVDHSCRTAKSYLVLLLPSPYLQA